MVVETVLATEEVKKMWNDTWSDSLGECCMDYGIVEIVVLLQ